MRSRLLLFPITVVSVLAIGAVAAWGATLVVDDDGKAAPGNCGAATPTYATIQGAVNASSPGGTVEVCPGFYPESVNVAAAGLTLNGAKAGRDARSRGASGESVVTAPSGPGFKLNADNITVDGFTVKNSLVGIETSSTHSGYLVQNNVLTLNTLGLYLNTAAGSPSHVRQNKITNNNRAGSASGNGIYSDQGATNVEIDRNLITNEANAGVGIFGVATGLNVHDNTIKNMSNSAVTFFDGVTNSAIDHNIITNGSANAAGGSAVFVGGNSSGIGITNNTITRPNYSGIAIRGTATNITIRGNAVKSGLGNGVDVNSTTPGATTTSFNTTARNQLDGIFYDAGTSGNTVANNSSHNNLGSDCHDLSVGTGTAGTANTWSANAGNTSTPAGLCS